MTSETGSKALRGKFDGKVTTGFGSHGWDEESRST